MVARSRVHTGLLAVAAIAVGVLVGVLLVIPGSLTPSSSSGGVSTTLVIGNSTGTLNSSFFGVDVHVVGNGSISLQSQTIGTPFVSFRFTPQGEATDQIHSIVYNQSGVGSPVYDEGDSAFIAGCKALGCSATMMVPAEIDNPAEAAATVLYVEKNLSFHPQYWAIGNEPQQWTHWGIPWTQWRPSDHSSPSPMAYALEVQQYVLSIRAVDPTAKLIGLESVVGGTTDAAWFRDLVQVDGPNISAVAYHAYPGGNGSIPGSLTNFYGALTNPISFPLNYPATVALVRQACPSCQIPVFVDEFNSALGGNYSGLMTTFPEVPFTAAALSIAIQENVPRTMFFDLEDLDGMMPYGLLTLGAPPRPAFFLFTGILDHLLTGTVLNVTAPGAPNGVTALLTENTTAASLMLVNTNLSSSLTFAIPDGLAKLTGPGTSYSWDDGSPGPIAGPPSADPAGVDWNLLPQSVLLIVWDR
jgi:hypothetical protein